MPDQEGINISLFPPKEPAQVAYEAYGKYVTWLNYQGVPMPPWEGLALETQGAWTAAIKAVLPDA